MTARAITSPSVRQSRPATSPAAVGTGHLSFVVILYLMTIALPVHFDIAGIFMTSTRAVLLVTTIPIAVRLFTGKLGRVLPTDVLLLTYILWAISTLFINSRSQAITIGGSYAVELYGSYLLARNYIRTPEQFRAVCRALLAVLAFVLPFAIYETQTGRPPIPLFIAKLPAIYSWNDYYNVLAGRRLGLERSQVIFSHPIHFGLFCASMISLALVAFKGLIPSFQRYLLGGMVCAGVIASVSSGALLPMALQVGLMLWAWVLRPVRARWVILISIIVVCYVIVDILANRSPVTVFLSYATLSPGTALGRIQIFEWGMNNVWKNPIIGIGLNDWERPWWKSSSMDNFWLLVTVRYGIPGFFLLISAYFWLVWKVARRNLGDGGAIWQFRRAWVFMQIGIIVTLSTVDVWATIQSYVFFLLGCGAWFVSASVAPAQAASVLPVPSHQAPALRYTRFAQDRISRRNAVERGVRQRGSSPPTGNPSAGSLKDGPP